MVTKEKVLAVLKDVYDPEIPINIVDLGLVYDIQIGESGIKILMTLTTPHCPLAGFLQENVRSTVQKMKDVGNVDVELVWEPPWTPERMSRSMKEEFGM